MKDSLTLLAGFVICDVISFPLIYSLYEISWCFPCIQSIGDRLNFLAYYVILISVGVTNMIPALREISESLQERDVWTVSRLLQKMQGRVVFDCSGTLFILYGFSFLQYEENFVFCLGIFSGQ